MELYTKTSAALAAVLTEEYSTSFSAASKLFDPSIRKDIYNIYGLVRIADEIVDTYNGHDQAALLDAFEQETYAAMERGFSTNPIIHAFAQTASQFGIDTSLLMPFFESMRTDIDPQPLNEDALRTYIYGSAEVVGLMCLRVFCKGDDDIYNELAPGAQRLGAAYQKVNFLRDIAADHDQLGRYYFAGSSFETLDEPGKAAIIADITRDFEAAKPYLAALPITARQAVSLSYRYYLALLNKLDSTPITVLKKQRVRLSKLQKIVIYAVVRIKGRV